MRQVRIQKRSRLTVALVAVMAASALLSAFQPASATPVPGVPVPIVDSGRASGYVVQQGDFEINVSVFEDLGGGALCARIRHIRGEEHRGCASGADVDVSDTLDSAWGRGTNGWSTSVEGKGRSKTPTYKYGTLTIDVTWTGTGDTTTNLDPGLSTEVLNCSFPGWDDGGWCPPEPDFYQTRSATWSGTITDSEWGTFVVNGGRGSLYQSTF